VIRPDCYFCVRHAASEGEAHTCLVRVHENTAEPGIRTLPQVKMAIRALAEIEQAIPYGPLLPCDDEAPYCAFRPGAGDPLGASVARASPGPGGG